MLRLVKTSTKDQGGGPPRRRRSSGLSLTPDEARHLRVALRNIRWAYGSWACVSEVMGVEMETLTKFVSRKSHGSPGIALRAAQAAGMHVEALLSGTLTAVGRCPTCGCRVGTQAVPTRGGR